MRANQDARKLYSAGERRLGTDESAFNAILASQNFAQLRAVFIEYEKVTGHGIERAIESEFSGDIKDGLIAIIKCVKNRPAFFAECLYNSMKVCGWHRLFCRLNISGTRYSRQRLDSYYCDSMRSRHGTDTTRVSEHL